MSLIQLSTLQDIPQAVTNAEQNIGHNVSSAPPPRALPSVLKDRTLEKPLPVPYVLPSNYPPLVAAGLQGKHLTGKAMVKFITVIANNIFNHKCYPTKEEKEHVARQCVRTFPFLEASSMSGHVSVLFFPFNTEFTCIILCCVWTQCALELYILCIILYIAFTGLPCDRPWRKNEIFEASPCMPLVKMMPARNIKMLQALSQQALAFLS